jgi:hypothetical protein
VTEPLPSFSEKILANSKLIKRVEGLARGTEKDFKTFHQTRHPFTRLNDVLGPIQAERAPIHPSHCHVVDCGQALIEQFYRRADGFVMCPQCFGERQKEEGEQ